MAPALVVGKFRSGECIMCVCSHLCAVIGYVTMFTRFHKRYFYRREGLGETLIIHSIPG